METITTANIWTEVGTSMTGFITAANNFFTALWDNPMGKIIITVGLVSAAIGLTKSLFLRRKRV